jgi:predicted CXXCH cytochrome family protein
MKKFLIAMALGALLVFALATTVTADNGPHGGFNGSTEACASCHRAHSAQSADGMLLVASDIYDLCVSCHDGTGAYTNVVDGYYDTSLGDPDKANWPGGQGDSGVGLFGGGFVNTRMLTDYGNAGNSAVPGLAEDTLNAGVNLNNSATSWARWNAYDLSAAPVSRPVTSAHSVDGSLQTVWGSGNYQASAVSPFGAGTYALECTSCHDPHGNAGKQGGQDTGAPYPSYRILRFEPHGSNGFEVAGAISATGYWDTDLNWAASVGAPWASTLMLDTTGDGVTLPDPAVKWYTINSDITLDPSVGAYRGRYTGGEIYVAVFAGLGDYGGRYYAYRRPAATANIGAVSGTVIDCPTITNPPTNPPALPPANVCGAATGTAFNNFLAHDAMGFWCSTCHDRYLAPGGSSRTTDSTDPGYHYRHRAQGISGSGMGTGQYTCVDCHNAHGTSATASPLAASASYAGGSVLLKADNRAICVRCHAGAVNFFNVTTSPGAPMIVVP